MKIFEDFFLSWAKAHEILPPIGSSISCALYEYVMAMHAVRDRHTDRRRAVLSYGAVVGGGVTNVMNLQVRVS